MTARTAFPRRSFVRLAAAAGAALATCGLPLQAGAASPPAPVAAASPAGSWLVTPQAAADLIRQGALVIDARGTDLKRRRSPLAGSVALVWQDLSEPNLPTKGRPLPVDQATRKLQALGVSRDRPIVVLADSLNGWGEDGRVAWLLRHWGHTQTVMVDGGFAAVERIGGLSIRPAAAQGDFVAKEHPTLEIKTQEVKARLGAKDVAFLDTRESREYEGRTPYGESRGGHLPAARHLFFKDLIDKEGRLLPRPEIEKLLAARGVTRDKEVVSYCTGGIRSGWMTAVLNDMGFKARNYAGSMWEWSAQPAGDYPLEK